MFDMDNNFDNGEEHGRGIRMSGVYYPMAEEELNCIEFGRVCEYGICSECIVTYNKHNNTGGV